MRKRFRRLHPRRPSPALVISVIALFVSLGGTGYATLVSGTGADHMFGGAGGGFVDYETAKSGVTASHVTWRTGSAACLVHLA